MTDDATASGAVQTAGNPPIRRATDWDADRLSSLADEYGTPLYVLDLARVRQNLQRIRQAFPMAAVYYAAKANACGAVLETVDAAGAGVECASAGEVDRARRAGVSAADILHTAVNPPSADLDYIAEVAAADPAVTVTAGALDTIDRLVDRNFAGRVLLRVHPGIGAGHHESVATGGDAKFGVPVDRAIDAIRRAADAGLEVAGLHAHAGSGIDDDSIGAHRQMVETLARLATESPVAIETVDVGGGFGVPYRPTDPPVDIEAIARETRAALEGVDAQLAIEPGRYVVADAGMLMTEVNTVKPADDETIVGVDAGMTTLLRPALYGAYHEVVSLNAAGDDRQPVRATITGPICEGADVLAADRTLPRPVRGDRLAIGNAGAYGYEMANHYNSRPRPATVVLDGDRAAPHRRRETYDDLVRLEREVEWR